MLIEASGAGRSHQLLVRLAPPGVRLHATSERPKPSGPHTPPRRFASFLRAHIRGGRIGGAEQLGRERIVKLSIHRSDGETLLWLRLWSNAGNAVLTDPGLTILDALYRRPKRGELTGRLFTLPSVGRQERQYAVREIEGEGSFNSRLDRATRDAEREERSRETGERAIRALHSHEEHLQTRLTGMESRLREHAGYERIRASGDSILANLGSLAKGTRWLELDDERIELDPRLTPSENAQAFFTRYKRSRSICRRLETELEQTKSELERLRTKLWSLGLEGADPESLPDAAALREALEELGLEARRTEVRVERAKGRESGAPGLRFRSGAFTILVGRSSAENDELLRRHVRGNDTWFHCRDHPGAYVFVRSLPGKSIPLEVMLDAANLAVHYSKAKSGGAADVYYTPVKYLRRPKDGPAGLVLPTQEKNLRVRLEPARVERLKQLG